MTNTARLDHGDTPTIAATLASAGFEPTLPTGGTCCEWALPSTRLRAAYLRCEWGTELVLDLIGEHEQPDWTVRIEHDLPVDLATGIVEATARSARSFATAARGRDPTCRSRPASCSPRQWLPVQVEPAVGVGRRAVWRATPGCRHPHRPNAGPGARPDRCAPILATQS